MKSAAWQQFFRLQREQHGKRVFTVTELANAGRVTPAALNVELSRLIRRGIVARYARGCYGPAEGLTPEEVLPWIDSLAYLTGFYALYRHSLVTQSPVEITCFTARRHNRSRERQGPFGKFVMVCVSPRIYARPTQSVIAPAEQAFCDFLYLACRKALRPETLVTFQNLDRLSERKLNQKLKRYPQSVSRAVWRILEQHSNTV